VSVAAVNSSLQRARPELRRRLPPRRQDWAPAADPTAAERAVLQRFMDAIGRADDAAVAALLAEDARCGQQPRAGGHTGSEPVWYSGRDTLVAAWAPILHGPQAAEFRFVLTTANRQPAAAQYIRPRGSDGEFRAFALTVARIDNGVVAELSVFAPEVLPSFGLPMSFPPTGRLSSEGSINKEDFMADRHGLDVDRVIDAPAEAIFDTFVAMYDSERPDWVTDSKLDLRPGGRWSVGFQVPGEDPFREERVITAVDRPHRLAYDTTVVSDDAADFDLTVEITVTAVDGGQRIRLVQQGFPTTERRDEFAGAWPAVLDEVARRVTRPGGSRPSPGLRR
jgi:uncharacterized protein YndB with AHSA1/START domain